MAEITNRRILIVDDTEKIHEDFHKILSGSGEGSDGIKAARSAFLGKQAGSSRAKGFELTSAHQGDQALDIFIGAIHEDRPFAVAFVDVRMPPGWDGVKTIKHFWEADPDLQVVICTAYSDYSLDEIVETLGYTDRLLILKKPFDPVEVRQLATALTEKWVSERRSRHQLQALRDAEVRSRQYAESLEKVNLALETATRRAEAANKAKSSFLANMSHEIRTPMTAILGYTDLICDESTSREEKDRHARIVRKSSEHLLTVLNDVLDISKIEAGQLDLAKEDLSPLTLCEEVLSLMAVRAEEKGIDLSFESRGKVPASMSSDPVRLRQVLLNLVGNAIKFTHKGSVRIVLRVEDPRDHPIPLLRFDVIDTGVGIAQEDVNILFDAFRQADNSMTRNAGGTGLGLTISRRLAHMLGGDIEVFSEIGHGSTFSLWLENNTASSSELATVSTQRVTSRDKAPSSLADLPKIQGRLLLVEDTPLNQVLISTILRKAGADVSVAKDGAEGCDAVREAQAKAAPYDLVLMDMQMPVLDGYQATGRLRDEGFNVPIIALTAHALAEDRDRCLDAGCSDYTTKPVNKRVLVEKCLRWLGQEEPVEPAESAEPESALPADTTPLRKLESTEQADREEGLAG